MRLIFTFLSLICISATLVAQSIILDWAKKIGGNGYDVCNSITTDEKGNIYATGEFSSSSVDFDPGPGVFNLSASGTNIFVSKFDSLGNFVWAQSIDGNNNKDARSITIDLYGSVYITGQFAGTTDFDPSNGIHNLTSNGNYDIFICKLDSSGNFKWACQIGGILDEQGLSISIDNFGNVYTIGYFDGNVDFDPGSGIFNLTSNGLNDIFICKINSSGNFLWAKQFGSLGYDGGTSIVTDQLGNVYSTGTFSGIIDFDPDSGIFNLTSTGGADIFLSKLDSSGNFLWAKNIGGLSSDDVGQFLTVDTIGNLYVTGQFWGTVDFNPDTTSYNLTSAGNADIFVSKFDLFGNFVWAKQIGGPSHDFSYSMIIDNTQSIYITGEFQGVSDFDPDTLSYNLSSFGSWDVFIFKLDAFGHFVWAEQIGGVGDDHEGSVAIDNIGNIYIAGYFNGTADFDPGAGVFNMTSLGFVDIFIEKFRQQVVGISEDPFSISSFNVFPNPTKEFAVYSFYLTKKSSVIIRLIDLLGREVWGLEKREFLTGNHSEYMNLKGVKKGMYFLNIEVDDYSRTIKLLKQ